jgi:hypothetical protein
MDPRYVPLRKNEKHLIHREFYKGSCIERIASLADLESFARELGYILVPYDESLVEEPDVSRNIINMKSVLCK